MAMIALHDSAPHWPIPFMVSDLVEPESDSIQGGSDLLNAVITGSGCSLMLCGSLVLEMP